MSGLVGETIFQRFHFDSADSWDFLVSGNNDYSSSSIIDFSFEYNKGNNITESAGNITVSKYGWYFITCNIGNWSQSSTQIDVKFRKSDPGGDAGNSTYVSQAGRILISSPNLGESYGVTTMSWITYLRSTDICHMYGTGYLYGNTSDSASAQNATNRFVGFRIGA